jgi:Ser/Thr protein kinase RdoA (MazF antagonist)
VKLSGPIVAAVDASSNDDPTADEADLLRGVAAVFGLGEPITIRLLAEGLMNRNWQITTPAGRYAVKQLLDVGPNAARSQHRAIAALADSGIPAVVPLTAPDGDTLTTIDGSVFSAARWVDGHHRRGVDLSLAATACLGRLLGQIHGALTTTMPPAPSWLTATVTDLGTAHAKLDAYLQTARERPDPDPFDTFVTVELERRRRVLDQFADLRPIDGAPTSPAGWTHGDFQHLNLLWRGGRVVAVLDWDRLAVRPLVTELARSASLLFGHGDTRGLDLERVAAFARAYRAEHHLTDDDIADGVQRLWWERVTNDLWPLRRRYEHRDDSCNHLFRSASALLEWWTEHLDEVAKAFTGG